MKGSSLPVYNRVLLPLLALQFLVVDWAGTSRADDLFAITELESSGRNVAAELADVDGDGRRDLFVVVLDGIPPEEERRIRVYLQRADGSFPGTPDHTRPLPRWSAVYDVSDVRNDAAGQELVLLRPDRVTLVSLASATAPSWDLPLPGPSTVGLADDERGFEPFQLVYRDFGDEPWLLVPQVGRLTAISPRGAVLAELAVPRRANYFVLPTNLLSLETDFQVFVDVPKLMVGDVNGDGRADITSATRHEIRVFLQQEGRRFHVEPDRTLSLRLMTARDHIRGSGGVASEARDIDGDGRLDLLLSHVRGGFQDAVTTTTIYMNRDGRWHLDRPDQTLHNDASLSSNALRDFLGDGHMELLRLEFEFGLLQVIQILVSREIDVNLSLYRYQDPTGFETDAWVERKLELPFSFETLRLKGFVPTASEDVNGDGIRDFVSSGGGKAMEIFVGGLEGPFQTGPIRQSMSTAGQIRFADWSNDGLADFVIFDPHHFDVPVRLGRNLGKLPGTPPELRPNP